MSKDEGYTQHSANDTRTRRTFKEYRNFVRNEWVMVLSLLVVGGLLTLGGATFASSNNKTFEAAQDTYVSENTPAKSFNGQQDLGVRYDDGGGKTTFLSFNVSGVSGKKVNSVKLRIRSRNFASAHPVNIYVVPVAAPLNGLTWNNQPSLAGAEKIGSLNKVSKWTWNEITVNKGVWADGQVELALVGTSNDPVEFSAIESKAVPKLLFDLSNLPTSTGTKPTVNISTNPATLTSGGSTTLTWASTNSPSGCTASGDWTGAKAPAGTEVVPNLTAVKTYNFTLSCNNNAGIGTATAQATVNGGSGGPVGGPNAPVVHIAAAPANITTGASSTLTWSSTNNPTSCTASGSWNGAKAASGSQSTGALTTAQSYTYTLACANTAGSSNASVTVVATSPNTPPPPTTTPPPVTPPPGAQVVGVPYICNGPVNNLVVRGIGADPKAILQLNPGCTGTMSFDLTLGDGGVDGVKVQAGAHDLNITSGRIICQGQRAPGAHQDGVQVQGGTNVTFHNLFVSCPNTGGAGAFYIDGKDFPGINNVICDSCNLEHTVIPFIYTTGLPPEPSKLPAVVNSGVRNSILHMSPYQGNQCWTHPSPNPPYNQGSLVGIVNDNNTCVP